MRLVVIGICGSTQLNIIIVDNCYFLWSSSLFWFEILYIIYDLSDTLTLDELVPLAVIT